MHKNIVSGSNVHSFGKGTQPMLFAHGFGCDQHMWRYITPAFKDNYRIILFDYIGSGKSDIASYNAERYSTLNGYAQDILEICDALQLSNVILVCHSVSCMIGLLAALDKPVYFSKIIMIGPSPCYINDEGYTGGFQKQDIDGLLETMEKNYIGWANFLAPQIIANKERPEFAEELTESFCSTDPVIAQQFARATFFSDNRADVPGLTIPALILQCSEDIIAPLEVGDYLMRHLPKSKLRVMKATGHCPHLTEPQETIVLIKDYLGSEA